MRSAKPKMRVSGVAKRLSLILASGLAILAGPAFAQRADLVSHSAFRVCADPANMPASNDKGEGYENRIAELLAEKLGLPVEYTWYPMSTGFIRNTLRAAKCDVVIGYAQGHEMVLNTNHYMTSTYVLITPQSSDLAAVTALSDPALQGKRIGIVAGSAPATHMATLGLIGAAKPYSLVVDRRFSNPADDMMQDLASGEIDAAILWGPIGGPLVKSGYPAFKATPLFNDNSTPPRFFYRITMGVRQGEDTWKRELNSLIRRNQGEIDAILRDAGVPLLNNMGTEIKP